jgi:hypothetical protein
MKNTIAIFSGMLLLAAGMALAGQPDKLGAFGRDRASGVQSFQDGGANDTAPGASEWGKIAGERAETNGTLNQDYKQGNGGAPTKGKP